MVDEDTPLVFVWRGRVVERLGNYNSVLVQCFTIWHNSCVPDERTGNGGQERKPRSQERRRERTRGEGDGTGLRHENERLQRRNERLRRENDRLKRKIDHLEKQLAAARRAGFRQAAPFAKDRPQGRGGRPGRRAGAAYGRQACRP